MRAGDVVEVRSTYRGRVRWAFRHRVVADDGERFARAEAERVVAARPWPTGWEDWRP